jgi:hypothetical protein
MPRWTCGSADWRTLAEEAGVADQVTWPVRLARRWRARRHAAVAHGHSDADADLTALLWARVERAFRLLEVADQRPDPTLTRTIAGSLLDEVERLIGHVRDEECRTALARAVQVVRGRSLTGV